MKNKEIEELLNEFKKGTHLFPEYREIILSYIEQLETKVKNLQNQVNTIKNNNEELKRRLKLVQQKRDTHKAVRYRLQNNRDKAIEILERHSRYSTEELLNILKR